MMRIDVITLFPDMFSVVRDSGVTGRAHAQGLWQLQSWNPRDYTLDVHRTVDDRPYGGGPGMVMMAEPLRQAVSAIQADLIADKNAMIDSDGTSGMNTGASSTGANTGTTTGATTVATTGASTNNKPPVILLSPTGKRFDQAHAAALATSAGAIFVCGRYEGIDQRFIDACVDEQWSLGDFVLSGGEIAALAMIDSAVRLIPGALNHGDSCLQDSFQDSISGLLDSPHFTRPESLDGQNVPEVLLSGHHAHIARWRREQSLALTAQQRPELLLQARERGLLTKTDEKFLASLRF